MYVYMDFGRIYIPIRRCNEIFNRLIPKIADR